MYDESWYTSIVPPSQVSASQQAPEKRSEPAINDGTNSEMIPAEAILNAVEGTNIVKGPPQAIVARRAKSYSDFYNVVRAQCRKSYKLEREREREKEQVTERRLLYTNKHQQRLETDEDVGSWYNSIKGELLDASHQEYQTYKDQLLFTESHLEYLFNGANKTLMLLSNLSASFKAVETQTTAFQGRCEGLLNDHKRTVKLADSIAENLNFYTYLEPISRRLNAPGASNLVRSSEFSEMLSNLDACLDYLQAHPNQRDSSTYRSRYRLLLTRALTLIRGHFTNSIRDVATDVAKRLSNRQLNETTLTALLYAKFRVPAPELRQLGIEIQRRAVPPAGAEPGTEAEYQSLMNELYQSYSATRMKLLRPIITKKMADIAAAPSTSENLVHFARSSISFIRGVCFDEYKLWGEWFASDENLYDFLESIVEPFHDYMRPRTIHETQLLKLCELCTLIQTRYMENEDDSEPDSPQGPRLNFSALIQPSLEDAQTRLVFLAMSTLRNDIEYYKPKPEDLDYPARNRRTSYSGNGNPHQPALSGRKDSNGLRTQLPQTPLIVDEDTPEGAFMFEPAMQDCYPTLRKAVWLLGRIYRLVNSAVFDDLAHQIVHQTTLSLQTASTAIGTRSTPTDAQLFLIKHLLTLKQQIVAFDIEFVTPDITLDFTNLTSTFSQLRSRGGLFNPANLVRLVGSSLVPRVVRNMLDAKAELDDLLRSTINEFIESFSRKILAPIQLPALPSKTAKDSFNAEKATSTVRSLVESDTHVLRQKLVEYLGDSRTRETLVAAVMDHVVQGYEEFFREWSARSGAGDSGAGKGGKKGKASVDEVWDPNVFTEWAAGVFCVGRSGFQGDDGDGIDGEMSSQAGSDVGSL